MTQENIEKIREGLRQLDEATNGIQGLSVFALVMPHGTRGQMQVQILSKGGDTQVAHKLYECMRCDASLPFSLTNIIMTAAAKYMGEQGNEARQAFDRTVEKCRKQWEQTQEVAAVIDNCRQVIDALDEQSETLATEGTQEINSEQ
jgi:hypothetical protein